MPEYGVKGAPIRLFSHRSANGASDKAVDCRGYNAVLVEVYVTGAIPSATLTVQGASAEGGTYLTLPDPNATQAAVAASKSFDVVVGAAFVKVAISSISGTFGEGRGYTVIVTPYISPGQSNITILATASQNLAQYLGVAVGPANAVDVKPGTGATFAVSGPLTDTQLRATAVPVDSKTATPTLYNITCTAADTEYSQALPANCRRVELQARSEAAIRLAFGTGKVAGPVAPYMTLKSGDAYDSGPINQGASPSTLYLASAVAGTVVEILAWT